MLSMLMYMYMYVRNAVLASYPGVRGHLGTRLISVCYIHVYIHVLF